MIDGYVRYLRSEVAPGTVKLRTYYLHRAAAELGDLTSATHHQLQEWFNAHPAWGAETRKSAQQALRSFYRWAIEVEEIMTTDPTRKLKAVRVPSGVPRPVPTVRVINALTRATDRDRQMISLAAFAGLRRAEIAGLRWADIEWYGMRIRGKGGKLRTVPMLPQLRTELDAEAERRERGIVGTGWRYEVDPASPFVFPNLTGGHMSPDRVGRILAGALGEGWSGHTLRHRFASSAYAVDRDILTVQRLMGHSDPATTARYTATPAGAALRAVEGSGLWSDTDAA